MSWRTGFPPYPELTPASSRVCNSVYDSEETDNLSASGYGSTDSNSARPSSNNSPPRNLNLTEQSKTRGLLLLLSTGFVGQPRNSSGKSYRSLGRRDSS